MGEVAVLRQGGREEGPWSPEEDDALRAYIELHGTGGSWISLPKKAGLRRCGKSCRLRWLNYLRPDIRHGDFTDEEDAIIISLYSTLGSKWSLIASRLERRTDNDVKNYWNTKLKKRLAAAASSILPVLLAAAAAGPAPALAPVPTHPSLLPLAIPTVKIETYTCDDFLVSAEFQDPFAGCADADGSTLASAVSSASNWLADNGASDGGRLFPDLCMGSDLAAAAADPFLAGYYYPIDPSLSLV